jgi:hypothetical protein
MYLYKGDTTYPAMPTSKSILYKYMTRRNAPKDHDGESKGIDNTVVTRATGLRPMWLGQGQSTIQWHKTGAVKTGRRHRHSGLAAV